MKGNWITVGKRLCDYQEKKNSFTCNEMCCHFVQAANHRQVITGKLISLCPN